MNRYISHWFLKSLFWYILNLYGKLHLQVWKFLQKGHWKGPKNGLKKVDCENWKNIPIFSNESICSLSMRSLLWSPLGTTLWLSLDSVFHFSISRDIFHSLPHVFISLSAKGFVRRPYINLFFHVCATIFFSNRRKIVQKFQSRDQKLTANVRIFLSLGSIMAGFSWILLYTTLN